MVRTHRPADERTRSAAPSDSSRRYRAGSLHLPLNKTWCEANQARSRQRHPTTCQNQHDHSLSQLTPVKTPHSYSTGPIDNTPCSRPQHACSHCHGARSPSVSCAGRLHISRTLTNREPNMLWIMPTQHLGGCCQNNILVYNDNGPPAHAGRQESLFSCPVCPVSSLPRRVSFTCL